MKTIQKKIISAILLISIGLFPNVIYAQNIDPLNEAKNVLKIIKDYGLDTLANSLAQMAGAKLSNKIVNKSTGGASGDSSQNGFITNFADYFANLDSQQVDKFVTDLGISNNPYAAGIAKSVIKSAQGAAGGQSALSAFDLDKVIGANYKQFANDASVGGWDGFLALSNPANTNIGSALIAKQEIAEKIEKAKELEKIKLASTGIKPQGKCNKSFSDYKADVNRQKERINSIKANKEILAQLNAATNAETSVPVPASPFNNNSDILGDGPTPEPEQPKENEPNINDIKKDIKINQAAIAGSIVKGVIEDYGGCLEEFINNPVGTSTGMITSALDAGSKTLSASDELGEVIAGMVLGLVNSFIKGGLTALNADFKPSKSSVGGAESLVGKNGQNINWTQTPYTIIDLQEEFPSAMSSTRYELSLLKKYNNTVAKDGDSGLDFADKIIALDQCIPGPDFRYKNRLGIYKKAQLSKLERLKEKGKDSNKKWRQAVYDDVNTSVDYATTEMDLMTQRPEMNIPGATIMQSQTAILKKVRTTFQQNQKDIIAKQFTINILSQIESTLKSSVLGLNAFDPSLAVPQNIAFTDHSWELMSPADQNTFVNWAKKLNKMPEKTPLFGTEWDALNAADKKTVVDWAKKIQGLDAIPTGSTEKGIVLDSAWLVAGIDPNDIEKTDTCDETCTVKKKMALSAIWSLWVNPERYITNLTEWVPGNEKFDKFIKDKSSALTSYNSIKNDIAIPYTIDKAEVALKEVSATIDQVSKLTTDCIKMKGIILQNSSLANDPDGHAKMLTILKTRVKEFITPEMREAILTGQSILSQKIGAYQADPLNNCGDGTCKQDIGVQGDVDDNDNPTNPGLAAVAENFQVEPAKSVWDLLNQKNAQGYDISLCRLNRFTSEYVNYATKNYKPVICDPSGWMSISKKSIVSYLFNEDIVD